MPRPARSSSSSVLSTRRRAKPANSGPHGARHGGAGCAVRRRSSRRDNEEAAPNGAASYADGGPRLPVALLAPRIGVVVVTGHLPEARAVVLAELAAAQPLRALVKLELGDRQPHRAAVLRLQILPILLERHQHAVDSEVGARHVG